jgi:hypothetical protein
MSNWYGRARNYLATVEMKILEAAIKRELCNIYFIGEGWRMY